MPKINTYNIGDTYNYLSSATTNTGITASGPAIIRTISTTINEFNSGDIITIEAVFSKQGTAGGYYHEVWYNTANNLTNARKIYESSVNPTDDGLYIPASLTYSNVYCRLQIVQAGLETRALDPNRTFITSTFSATSDLAAKDATSATLVWETIGNQEGLTSIDWEDNFGVTLFIHFVGGVESSSDRLRCEWAKISGRSSGTFAAFGSA